MEAFMNINKELVGASTSILILKVLSHRPNYGYEIVRQVNEAAEGFFTWQEGTVYPALRKLEKEGLLRSQWEEAENGRSRKYYYITEQGHETIKEGTKEWESFSQLVLKTAEVPCV